VCVQYLIYSSFILNKLQQRKIVVLRLQWQMTRCLWQHLFICSSTQSWSCNHTQTLSMSKSGPHF